MTAILIHSSALRLPKIRHAFSTRIGGVSEGAYRSLNLGFGVGDQPEAVRKNLVRFMQNSQFGDIKNLSDVQQVHGISVAQATAAKIENGTLSSTQADAIWTSEPGIAVAVRTADCCPILIAAMGLDGPQAVAAVHAGWKGACKGIIHETISTLKSAGYSAHRMYAAIGPTIGPQAFEVGPEVVEAARSSLDGLEPRTQPGPRGRPLLDLPHLIARQLINAGIYADHIHDVARCTASEPEYFFSHRRDQGRSGRHLSAIQIIK